MEITNDVTPWGSENIAVFNQFLQTHTGRKLLPKLMESIPVLLESGETNDILIRTGKVSAWGDALRSLIALSAPPPAEPDTSVHNRNYPDPTDDRQWDDGKTTTGK